MSKWRGACEQFVTRINPNGSDWAADPWRLSTQLPTARPARVDGGPALYGAASCRTLNQYVSLRMRTI
jgi:hypothetical protein